MSKKVITPKTFTTISSSHYNHARKYDCDKRSQNFFVILIGQNMLMGIQNMKLNL